MNDDRKSVVKNIQDSFELLLALTSYQYKIGIFK